ncbi:unnamed protein product [Litomosoides sigmodontis]|uniref:Uncharacterized protein n=1 Tax=Litomosoides sigmodontis TaxID=42156 RepID=A0A3P6TPV0_LITSI|nr:unnamed protein product [Litomosoides sigmodontis]
MRCYYTNIHLIFIVLFVSISEIHALRRHMHNHDADETPQQISRADHALGKLLSLRTDDMISERDSVIDIRKGDRLTLKSGER